MLDFGIHNRFNSLPLCMLWIINWKWLAMGSSVNYTTVWGSFSVWPHEQSGELGSYSERTSDYDIIYRTLQRKPFSVNYLFYPIDCFWFLNSNLQCQNLLSFFSAFTLDILGYLQNRIKILWQLQGQIQLVQLFWENLYLGISCILVHVYWMM